MDLTYYGLASANGLESFINDETSINNATALGSRFGDMILGAEDNKNKTDALNSMISGMAAAARANSHRKSVVYKATVSPEVAETIEALQSQGDHFNALLILKSEAIEIALIKIHMAKKFWSEIPNKLLDPYN